MMPTALIEASNCSSIAGEQACGGDCRDFASVRGSTICEVRMGLDSSQLLDFEAGLRLRALPLLPEDIPADASRRRARAALPASIPARRSRAGSCPCEADCGCDRAGGGAAQRRRTGRDAIRSPPQPFIQAACRCFSASAAGLSACCLVHICGCREIGLDRGELGALQLQLARERRRPRRDAVRRRRAAGGLRPGACALLDSSAPKPFEGMLQPGDDAERCRRDEASRFRARCFGQASRRVIAVVAEIRPCEVSASKPPIDPTASNGRDPIRTSCSDPRSSSLTLPACARHSVRARDRHGEGVAPRRDWRVTSVADSPMRAFA